VKSRLDNELVKRGLVASRSQAESYIKLGKVKVDGKVVSKPGSFINENAKIELNQIEQYVGRAGLKLESVAKELKVDFSNKIVLDVGSSTGGFTEYALRHGAKKVYAVDVGTHQLHPSLRQNEKVELHEKTDIRDFFINEAPDIILIDVSFISLREILPHIHDCLSYGTTQILAMVKPQFEAGKDQTNKGIIKNEAMRRQILHDFENWTRQYFVIESKRDSEVSGAKGNCERFYLMSVLT